MDKIMREIKNKNMREEISLIFIDLKKKIYSFHVKKLLNNMDGTEQWSFLSFY